MPRSYRGNVEKAAEHLRWPAPKVRAALNYAAAYPEEIEQAIADNEAMDFEALARLVPEAERFVVAGPEEEKGEGD